MLGFTIFSLNIFREILCRYAKLDIIWVIKKTCNFFISRFYSIKNIRLKTNGHEILFCSRNSTTKNDITQNETRENPKCCLTCVVFSLTALHRKNIQLPQLSATFTKITNKLRKYEFVWKAIGNKAKFRLLRLSCAKCINSEYKNFWDKNSKGLSAFFTNF